MLKQVCSCSVVSPRRLSVLEVAHLVSTVLPSKTSYNIFRWSTTWWKENVAMSTVDQSQIPAPGGGGWPCWLEQTQVVWHSFPSPWCPVRPVAPGCSVRDWLHHGSGQDAQVLSVPPVKGRPVDSSFSQLFHYTWLSHSPKPYCEKD